VNRPTEVAGLIPGRCLVQHFAVAPAGNQFGQHLREIGIRLAKQR
jgi:hypothetical protein